MKLYMKNMVCNGCILVVQQKLDKLNINICKVSLGEVETTGELSKEKVDQLEKKLAAPGFELLDN
jgi:AraC family transcriptional regulator